MTVEAGYPDTLALEFNGKLLDIKLNGNAFLQSPYVAEERVYVGHCRSRSSRGFDPNPCDFAQEEARQLCVIFVAVELRNLAAFLPARPDLL